MNKSFLIGAVSACAITLSSFTAHAVPVSGQGTWESTLQGRNLDGNVATFEAYYDTTLDITWLADANAAGSNMTTFADASAWAAGLNVYGVTGWRLPIQSPINGTAYQLGALSTDATTDKGYAPTTTDGTDGGWRDALGNPVSEMGHMYYVTLANLGFCDPGLPWCTEQSGWGASNTGPFANAANFFFTTDAFNNPWLFNFSAGSKTPNAFGNFANVFAWAVHPGDVGSVPVPAAVWLFGSGFLGLISVARVNKA